MRRRSFVLIVFLGLAAVVIASVISMRPSLDDARNALDDRWADLESQLDARYERLASLSRAVRAQRAELEVLDQVDDALGEWKASTSRRPTPDPRDESETANQVEAPAARLARSITTSPSLRTNQDVVLALREFLTGDAKALVDPYNQAVERYDRARNRFPGAFFASLLGFPSVSTVEIPKAYDEIGIPEPPPETTTTSGSEPSATTTTAP